MPFACLAQRRFLGRLAGITAIAIAAFAAVPASSQPAAQWPERPVRLLVPVGAGGALTTGSASGFTRRTRLRRSALPLSVTW